MALAKVLPASRASRPISGWISASIRSAARSRIAARSAGGVACQIGAALRAHWIALSTSSTVASCTWPTTSRRSDGFKTGAGASLLETQPSIGAAFQWLCAVARSAQDSEAKRCSLAMSMPLELARSEPYRSRGSGMRGCGRPKPPSTVAICSMLATGSATSSWIEIDWSAIRLTNEVFAPFSSRRRTR
ncbi:hypothetical protein D3C81_1609940 [compost metagenome]